MTLPVDFSRFAWDFQLIDVYSSGPIAQGQPQRLVFRIDRESRLVISAGLEYTAEQQETGGMPKEGVVPDERSMG
jgi:hypothetical protein